MSRIPFCAIVLAAVLATDDARSAEGPPSSGPAGFALVTELEAAADLTAKQDASVTTRSVDDGGSASADETASTAPAIEVVTPDTTRALRSPISLDIRFHAAPGAMIALHTVRLKYGVMGLDMTERIRNVGAVTKEGIRALGAELPVGQHSFTVEVEDTLGARTRHRFTLNIIP